MKLYGASPASLAAAAADADMPRGAVKAAILLKRDTCAVDRGAKLSYETFVVVVAMLRRNKTKNKDQLAPGVNNLKAARTVLVEGMDENI